MKTCLGVFDKRQYRKCCFKSQKKPEPIFVYSLASVKTR